MFYLGIDQHARQITISLRDENGDVVLARQVSKQPAKIKKFFQRITRKRLRSVEVDPQYQKKDLIRRYDLSWNLPIIMFATACADT